MEVLATETYITIVHDTERGWLYANWTGDQSFTTVREGCLLMLDVVKQKGATKILNDNRAVTSSWSDAANWVGNIWFPAMAAAGVRYFAWVYSPFVFSRLSTDTSISYAKGVITIGPCDTLEEAEAWLSAQSDSEITKSPSAGS